MRPPRFLSNDPRTAPLFSESGCKDIRDSQLVLDAIGSAKQVAALARGRHGGVAVAVVVADGRMLLLPVGLFAGASSLRVDCPAVSVTLTTRRPRLGRPGHTTILLRTPAAKFDIEDVPDGAVARLLQALSADMDSSVQSPAATSSGFALQSPPLDATGAVRASEFAPAARDWRQAEQLAAWHLRQLGYIDARLTGEGADSGVDVLAVGVVAQVKHQSQAVGQPPLRDLFGAAQAAGAKPFFYSLAGYTVKALEWATAINMPLFTYTVDGQVLAHNSAAHALLPRSASPGEARLGIFEQARANKYRREQAKLRQEIESLTSLMHKRTQSRRASTRQKAGVAAGVLTQASRALDAGDVLPHGDRRREDTYKAVRKALTRVKQIL